MSASNQSQPASTKAIRFQEFPREFRARGSELQAAVTRVMKSGYFILGPEVLRFEQQFAEYLGVKEVVGVANGLEALQIMLMAYDIGKGDEVITTPLSAVATTLAILAVGATPVFVDVDDLGSIDVNKIEAVITRRTKAVLPVHLYGIAADLTKLRSICRRHHLHLFEDAAQAHGSQWRGALAGSVGETSCFSFYPTKNLGALGDGGAIATNSTKIAKRCRQIRDYGQAEKYVHVQYGLNSRLDELHAAMLQVRLRYLDEDNAARHRTAAIYTQGLGNIPALQLVQPTELARTNQHLFVVRTAQRDALQTYLKNQGIVTLVHYPLVIPDQPFLREKYGRAKVPLARRFAQEVLSLPCHPFIRPAEVRAVVRAITQYFETRR